MAMIEMYSYEVPVESGLPNKKKKLFKLQFMLPKF